MTGPRITNRLVGDPQPPLTQLEAAGQAAAALADTSYRKGWRDGYRNGLRATEQDERERLRILHRDNDEPTACTGRDCRVCLFLREPAEEE